MSVIKDKIDGSYTPPANWNKVSEGAPKVSVGRAADYRGEANALQRLTANNGERSNALLATRAPELSKIPGGTISNAAEQAFEFGPGVGHLAATILANRGL